MKSFQPTRLTLQSSTAIDGGEIRIPVTGGSFTMTNGPDVTLTLTPADLNSVKLTAGIGDSPGNTYLRPFAVVASDVSSIVAVKQTPLPAFNVLADRAAPDLNHFVLDLSGDTVSLTLDEPVNASLLNFTQFTLFNSSDTATSPVEIPLDGTTTSPDGTEIVTQLPPDLALMIKTTADIATSISDTFIDYRMGLCMDVPENEIPPPPAGVQASIVVPGLTGPLVDSFDLDLDTGVLTLHHLEPADRNTFDGRSVTIQDASAATTSYCLSGGTYHRLVRKHQFLSTNLNAIKANIATTANNTYLILALGAQMDTFGNPVVAIVNGFALAVTVFTPDTTPPNITTLISGMHQMVLALS